MLKSCAVTGPRPTRFKFTYNEHNKGCVRLKGRLRSQFIELYRQGVRRFYVDGALGVGQWSGEILLRLKEQPEYADIELVVVMPYPGHDARWDERSRQRLAFLIRHSTEHMTIGTTACRESFLQRNRYMVDHADCLVAVYDGAEDPAAGEAIMVKYAKEKGVPMVLIHPDTAQITEMSSYYSKRQKY